MSGSDLNEMDQLFSLGRKVSFEISQLHEDFKELIQDHETTLLEIEAGTIVGIIFRELAWASRAKESVEIYFSMETDQ